MGSRRRAGAGAVVVSVGNIEVGGSGKTPFAAYLVNELSRRGWKPAYVSRGFRSDAEGLGAVSVLLPPSVEPVGWVSSGVRLLRHDAGDLSRSIGDEGAMVAARCPGAPLAFSRDRGRAVEVVCALFNPTHVILDDAMQTWSVARDVDVVLLDAERPLGNGRTIPAGSLREPPRALSRSHAIGFNGIEIEGRQSDALARLASLRDWAREMAKAPLPVFGVRRGLSFREPAAGRAGPEDDPVEPERGDGSGRPEGRVAALSSIGRPHRFEDSLRSHGVAVGLALRFPDHHRYRRTDIVRIERILGSRGIDRVATTEKDWVKLREIGPPRATVHVARLELDIVGDDPVAICEKPRALPAASA
jgi:tetraacyldisaccharide 4'-kinase